MRWIGILGAAILAAMNFVGMANCQDKPTSSNPSPQTFAIETYIGRAYNYLDRMVDKDGLPYFNIFWTDPAEAAHDWPDFGDVTSRQLQGAIMARHLTGRESRNEKVWMKMVLSRLDPTTGLLMRPKTSYCDPGADAGDQALTLYTLVTAYADSKDPALRDAIDKMIAHLPDDGDRAFIIKSLMTWVRLTGSPAALEQAKRRVDAAFGPIGDVHARQQNPEVGPYPRQLASPGRRGRLRALRERPRAVQPRRRHLPLHEIEGHAVRLSAGSDGSPRATSFRARPVP